MQSIPPFADLACHFESVESALGYLVAHEIVKNDIMCEFCGKLVVANRSRRTYTHRCSDGLVEISMFRDTFFTELRVPLNDVLKFAYYWLAGLTSTMLLTVCGFSRTTTSRLITRLSDLVACNNSYHDNHIGGEGIVVEIDESKLARRKYNRGHNVEGVWVIGGVEHTSERNVFFVPVENRSAGTIRAVISEHVRPGSIIRTDCWRGYLGIADDGKYTHETVNHQDGFRDATTGVHTNTIEGTWAALKMKISRRSRSKMTIGDNLSVFIWRRRYEDRLWSAFLDALRSYTFID